MSRGRLLGYARFQLGDYLLQRASMPLLLVLVVAGVSLYDTFRRQPDLFTTPQGSMVAHSLFTTVVTVFLPVGAFLGGTGVISSERQQGYFRFLFSKPVSPLAYYTQAYLVHGVVFVALFGALTWTFGAITVHQPVPRAMAAAALTFILIGGLGFIFSALTRFDGAVLAVTYLASLLLQTIADVHDTPPPPAWLVQLARLLPPVHALDQLRDHLYAQTAIDPAQCVHVLAYGLGSFGLGIVILRVMPLAR